MQAKKIAAQVAQIAKTSDNKRCFDCEQLGTTYYVPQFSTFVCTPCSGVHMQFGHRVKSITLADYSAHEAEQMQQGGNQVAAYRWLARYTPGKDLARPTDRNPQKTRMWIQTVFVDKRFFSADAPIPRRSTDSAGSAAGLGGAGTGGGSGSGPPSLSGSSSMSSSSFKRSSSTREGPGVPASPAARTSPVAIPSSPSMGRQQQQHAHAGSPPVHDVREILGEKAPALHVTTKGASAAAPAAPTVAPAAAPAATHQPAAAFDPFAAPPQPVPTPAVRPPSTGGFDPFQQQQQQAPAPAAAAPSAAPAPAGTAGRWASFDDAPAFPAASQPAASAASAPTAAPAAAAVSSGISNGGWADFGSNAFTSGQPASAGGAPAAASAGAPGAVGAGAAAGAGGGGPAAPAAVATTPVSPPASTGTPRSGKPPAKELAPDLFSDFGFGAAAAPGMVAPQQAAAMQYQQQAAMAAAMGAGMRPPMGPLQQPQMGMAGFGAAAPGGQQQLQVPAHLAWQVQQQAALQWQYQQQVQQQQQQQQQQGATPGYGMTSPRSAAAWGAQSGFGGVGSFGMPAGAVPGQMGMANGMAGGYGMPQQQMPPLGSGPSSVGGSGPSSGGAAANQWTLASATAGVTEQNAFADLVDLKSALPSSSAAAAVPAASMPQQQQLYGGQVPAQPAAAQAGYGAPGMMQYPGGLPAYGMMQQPGLMMQQPGMQPMQQQYGVQPGAASYYPQQQQQQPAWGAAPPAAPQALGSAAQPSDEGNPFA